MEMTILVLLPQLKLRVPHTLLLIKLLLLTMLLASRLRPLLFLLVKMEPLRRSLLVTRHLLTLPLLLLREVMHLHLLVESVHLLLSHVCTWARLILAPLRLICSRFFNLLVWSRCNFVAVMDLLSLSLLTKCTLPVMP